MRLPVEKIKAAILDLDQRVREEAVYYFARSYSPDPTIMPLAIQAIERYGQSAFVPYTFLQDLVQTDSTLTWLISEIERQRPNGTEEEARFANSLRAALLYADIELLKVHQARIRGLNGLDGPALELIASRISMNSIAPNTLWRRLSDFCEELDKQEEVTDVDFDYVTFLIKALARHPAELEERALSILSEPAQGSGGFLEIASARLAGELKLETAIPWLIDRLKYCGTWLGDVAQRALERIGTDAVVNQLAQGYSAGDWDFRLSVATILDEVHSDLSVQTALSCSAKRTTRNCADCFWKRYFSTSRRRASNSPGNMSLTRPKRLARWKFARCCLWSASCLVR